jgi:hypothetical protein
LGDKERSAVVMWFFGGKSFAEVAAAAGVSENAAKKRVIHALEKLHRYFAKRGVSSTTAIIAGAISTHSVQTAPVALVKAVVAIAVTKGAVASGSTLTLIKGALKIMAWTKAKTAIVVGAAAVLMRVLGDGQQITSSGHPCHLCNAPSAMFRMFQPRGRWTFSCTGKCGKYGDQIDYLKAKFNLDDGEAIRLLSKFICP